MPRKYKYKYKYEIYCAGESNQTKRMYYLICIGKQSIRKKWCNFRQAYVVVHGQNIQMQIQI